MLLPDRYNAGMQIRNHHQRAIDRLAGAYRDDPEFLGLTIGGGPSPRAMLAMTRMWTS